MLRGQVLGLAGQRAEALYALPVHQAGLLEICLPACPPPWSLCPPGLPIPLACRPWVCHTQTAQPRLPLLSCWCLPDGLGDSMTALGLASSEHSASSVVP